MKLTKEEILEIRRLQETESVTRRATVPALEEILYEPMMVLDHGFVRVVDYMGDDAAIVQAARVSYGKGTKKLSNDRGLIRYLLRHRHTTPFEMCEIKFHVKLPIFVARQWIRHRTANVNEYSARYSILDKEFYVPDRAFLESRTEERKKEKKAQSDLFSVEVKKEALASQSTENKQGRQDILDDVEASELTGRISSESQRAYTTYQKLLNEENGDIINENKKGLARELARMVLPTNYYTQWYWKIDLHNLLHFLSLRADSHAQYEIRIYAEKICEIVDKWVPLTWEAFQDFRQGGTNISAQGMSVVKRMIAGEDVSQEESGMSAREWRELMATLGRGE